MNTFPRILIPLFLAAGIVTAGSGCFMNGDVSSVDTGLDDFEIMEPTDSMVISHDIVVLNDSIEGDQDATTQDSGNPLYDTSVTQDATSPEDSGEITSDTYVPSDVTDSDSIGNYDVAADVVTDAFSDAVADVDSIRVECPHGDGDCPDGFLCADDKMGGRYCKPVGDCSMDGVTSIESLIRELGLINTSTPIFIKVAATVRMGTPTCSVESCDVDNPCCKDCFASLVIGDEKLPIMLTGQLEPKIGCMGNECDFDKKCTPLTPDTEYIIWGTAKLFGDGPALQIDGWCPVSDIVVP